MKDEKIIKKIKQEIADGLDLTEELSDLELLREIDNKLSVTKEIKRISVARRASIRKEIFDSFRRLDVLQELLDDEDVSEIMVNGVVGIYFEKNGLIRKWNKNFDSREKLEDIIQQIVSKVNRVVNTSSPIVDARLEDGSRVNVVLPPIAPAGPILTIRRFPKHPMTMKNLLEMGSISGECAEFLEEMVVTGKNIFISGGTGSGKTTFLNALSNFIPTGERVITIEDSLELQLGIQNLVSMEARNANAEGVGAVTIRDLIRTALRMRPDRIVVGEVRGPEALDMLQAMNTGHDGSLSTGHGNSARDMLSRLETMVLMGGELPLYAVRGQIASALDVMVHLGRMSDGKRKVISVEEVFGYEDGEIKLSEIYKRKGDTLERCGEYCGKRKKIE